MNDSQTETQTEFDGPAQAGVETETQTDTASDDLTQKLAQSEEKLAYLAAEFENYKRQTVRRLDEERQRAARRVIEQLLPAIDTFALAQQYAGTAQNVEAIKTGLDFVASQLETALKGAGLEPIPSVGEAFDPTKHDAIEEIEADGAQSGQIVIEAQRGYVLNGQILRPARVKVAK